MKTIPKPNSWYDSIFRWRLRRFLGLSLMLAACSPSAVQRAETGTHLAAIALDTSDAVLAPLAATAAERALASATDLADYQARTAPWRIIESALAEARAVVRLLNTVVQAWKAGAATEADWKAVVACLVPALKQLAEALERHDVAPQLSSVLGQVSAVVGPFAAPMCRAGLR